MRDGDNNDQKSPDFSFGNLCNYIPDVVFPIVGGCAAFGTTLAASTAVQKAIGISTGTQVVPSLLGFATVCAASLFTEQAAILSYQLKKDPRKRNFGYIQRRIQNQISDTSSDFIKTSSNLIEGNKKQFKLPMHEVRV